MLFGRKINSVMRANQSAALDDDEVSMTKCPDDEVTGIHIAYQYVRRCIVTYGTY